MTCLRVQTVLHSQLYSLLPDGANSKNHLKNSAFQLLLSGDFLCLIKDDFDVSHAKNSFSTRLIY